MRIILSTGLGRLHLVQAATWLAKRNLSVSLVVGWVPRVPDGWLVAICSRLVGRNLSIGLSKRAVTDRNLVLLQNPTSEFLVNILYVFCSLFHFGRTFCTVLGWRFFGWCSRKYLAGADIFHVRSGAGQGGAIVSARRNGLKILVDHSIAHPIFMERNLRSEYERYQCSFDMGISSPFWRMVLDDCEESDIVLVNSGFVRDSFVDAGFSPDRIRVVYQGTRPDFFGLRAPRFGALTGEASRFRLLFTGGFGFRKGGEYILDAMRILKEKWGSELILDVVGSYESATPLIQKYAGDSLPVTFHGQVPQDDLKGFLARSDIYVFPSLAEGCASSGLEAMAAGLCVIATVESGLPLVDGETGLIVPPRDALAIASKIEWLVENPRMIDCIGAKAAELIASEYTWEKYAEKVHRVYNELASRDFVRKDIE